MSDWIETTQCLLERGAPEAPGQPLELSLVELVLAASEFSEDTGEICDLVDGLIETGRVDLVAADAFPLVPVIEPVCA